ncbi:MAG: response regulator [Anaerolineae bacterium]|nr:response regulator [Anaerolineae bacterium]
MEETTQEEKPPATLRILIADDAAETRRTLRIMLSLDTNLEVVAVAEDGEQAVEMARLHQPDIALLDVNMPRLSGIEAIRAMLKDNIALNLHCHFHGARQPNLVRSHGSGRARISDQTIHSRGVGAGNIESPYFDG